jgi:hypothetical protein
MARDARPEVATVAEVVRNAAGIVDPTDQDALVGDFERWFEDDDDPVQAVPDFDRRIAGALDELDPEDDHPGLSVAAAVAIYLATRPRHEPRDGDAVIRQAVRLAYGDSVPAAVADWAGLSPHDG